MSQKNKKQYKQLGILGISLGIILFSGRIFWKGSSTTHDKTPPYMCYHEHCFKLEIADTPEKRQRGLMFRESLPKNQGMLFVFEKSDFWSFWMKNTLIPLDIIWLDEEDTVVDITSLPPCKTSPCPSYTPKAKATHAIELNSGSVAKIGLKIEEMIELRKLKVLDL